MNERSRVNVEDVIAFCLDKSGGMHSDELVECVRLYFECIDMFTVFEHIVDMSDREFAIVVGHRHVLTSRGIERYRNRLQEVGEYIESTMRSNIDEKYRTFMRIIGSTE